MEQLKLEQKHKDDGTIAPSGPASSIVFMPTEAIASLQYMYNTFPNLWGTKVNEGWLDGGEGKYTLSDSTTQYFSATKWKKVVYNKGASTYPYYYYSIPNSGDFTGYNKFMMKIYENYKVTVKFERPTTS